MILSPLHDPMGEAIRDFYERRPLQPLRVLSPQFEEDEFPVATLFRTVPDMPGLEREALRLCRGRVLDIGAGAGCHSLALQEAGLAVTAVDVSPLSVETMRRRGVRDVRLADFFIDEPGGPYDTLLFLMNGIGMAGTLAALPRLLERCAALLAPGGQVLADSSDLRYLFEDEDGCVDELPEDRYYGEVDYTMRYGSTIGRPFGWLYVDAGTLCRMAGRSGFRCKVVRYGRHYDYLARLERAD